MNYVARGGTPPLREKAPRVETQCERRDTARERQREFIERESELGFILQNSVSGRTREYTWAVVFLRISRGSGRIHCGVEVTKVVPIDNTHSRQDDHVAGHRAAGALSFAVHCAAQPKL